LGPDIPYKKTDYAAGDTMKRRLEIFMEREREGLGSTKSSRLLYQGAPLRPDQLNNIK
jgi:hypothetical protein